MAPWTSQYERASPSIFTQFVYCGRPFLQVHKSLFYITMTQWKAFLPLGIKFCRSRWNHDSRKIKKREYTIKSATPGASSRGRAYQTHFCQRLLVSVVGYCNSSEKRQLWKQKQWRLNRVLQAKVLLSRYFWPTNWILLRQLFLSPSWPLSQ